jgi:sulfide:quinone oxidoreductase
MSQDHVTTQRSRVLILGAGFGGITVASELRRSLGSGHEILLVDRVEHFAMGLRKLWALVGLGSYEEGSRSRELLNGDGVRFLQTEIRSLDPAARSVVTDQGTLQADYLVVALGAEPRPDLVPGLAEHAHNPWSPEGVPGLAAAVDGFRGGRIAIVIAGVPYACPPAPYECSMLLDDHLRERNLRDQTRMKIVTLQPMLLPNAGVEGSMWLGEQLTERGIEFEVKRKLERVEPGRFLFADGHLEAEILIGVPPHQVPAVVRDSGLTGEGEWIPVDPATLETGYERVFAIGDVTKIQLANGLPLPKAGVMAELEGQRVAAAIAADISGGNGASPFQGQGYCFMEMGKRLAALIEGDFYATPEPQVSLREPSSNHAADKHRFESDRLRRWFGA